MNKITTTPRGNAAEHHVDVHILTLRKEPWTK